MGRCETCANWKNVEPDWEYDALKMGTCAAIKQRETIDGEVREATGLGWGDEGRDAAIQAALTAAKAIAVDGSGYYAAVRTMADFGCVLHSPA